MQSENKLKKQDSIRRKAYYVDNKGFQPLVASERHAPLLSEFGGEWRIAPELNFACNKGLKPLVILIACLFKLLKENYFNTSRCIEKRNV